MSGSQTSPTDDTTAQLAQIMQMIQGQQQAPPAQPTQERSFVSLLGSALGGGSASPMATADEEAAGKRALMNFGINMLAAGGPSTTRVGFGQALARGLAGAGESEAASEGVIAARLGAQQDYQQKQQEMRLAAIKEAIPLLTLQQQRKLMGLPNPLAGGGGAPSIGAAGGPDPVAGLPKDQALAAIAQRESGNQNIFSNIKVEGYSQDQLGSGYYQIIPSTWREGAKLAGVDTTKYPLAINAPREVQDKVASALWDKYGAKPWAQSAPRAAPGGTGTATAATPPPATPTPPAASTAPVRTTPPPGVIQTDQPAGGATVAGPPGTAIVGAAKPAGPAVGGDVNTMIRGMIGAGANATTLAPGAATSGPVAPPAVVVAATPPAATPPAVTTTPPATPTPQMTTQQPTPDTRPDVELTPNEYILRHFKPLSPADMQTLTVPVDQKAVQDAQSVIADARKSQAAGAQDRQYGITPELRAKGNEDYNRATETIQKTTAALADLQQKAAIGTTTAAAKAAEDQRQRLTTTYNQLQAQKAEADRQTATLGATATENEKNRQSEIRKAELAAGYTATQKQADADIDIAKNDINARAAETQKAERIIPVLQQIQGQFGHLPDGFIGSLLAKYDTTGDLTGMLAKMGIVDPAKATAAQMLIAARNFLSIETKPAATGSLRIPEMDKLQAYTPGQLQTPQAQQEMGARLIAYQKRIQDEQTFAGNYFGRPSDPQDPNSKRIYDNRGLEKAMNAPVQYDQNGVVTGGGLGPVVPEPPPLNRPDPEHQAYINYVNRNVAPGMPYQTWEPKKNSDGSTALDARGQPIPQRVTKVKEYQ